MDQMYELFKLAALAMAVAFMSQLVKKSGRETEATLISIAGLIISLIIVVNYVVQFFQAVETMFTF